MTLLSRAPRQVYRVFDEQEFLAEDWIDALETAYPEGKELPGRERWHRRLVGAAMLCSAMGAVGGLVVVNHLSPVMGSRRSRDRSLRTAAEAIGPARVSPAHVWRASMLTDGLGRRSQHRGRVEAGRRARPGDARPVAIEVDTQAPGSVRRVAANLQRPRASASVAGAQPARAEFGFER
jgi:hypothetical protein